METNERRRRNRRVLALRRLISICMIVWGIFGLVGLFTILGWIVGAITGDREHAYGLPVAERGLESVDGHGGGNQG